MSEDGLAAKIAALPTEERASRYLKVIQDQGLSMATQKRWLDEKDEKIARLTERCDAYRAVVDAARKLRQVQPAFSLDEATCQAEIELDAALAIPDQEPNQE